MYSLCVGMGLSVNEDDMKTFLKDFGKADISKKLDMWYYAVEQEALWEELLAEMSEFAQKEKGGVAEEE